MGDSTPRPDLALVLSGGGARAAYQVGFLRLLTHEFPEIVPGILTGVSAGGINAAYLAAKPEPFAEKIADLASIWAGLSIEDVFRVDLRDLAGRTLPLGRTIDRRRASPLPAAKSLVDTAPLRVLLERVLEADGGVSRRDWRQPGGRSAARDRADRSNYTTGQSITWVQTRDDCGIQTWERPQRKSETCALRVDHVMASAALPFFFPAVHVDGAVARRRRHPADRAAVSGGPSRRAADHRGVDTLRRIARRSGTVPRSPAIRRRRRSPASCSTPSFSTCSTPTHCTCSRSTTSLPACPRTSATASRRIDLLVLRPSEDLGRLANEYEPDLPRAFRFLTRGLGTREARSNDLLSLLMFQSDYIKRLIQMGEADAAARLSTIRRFLDRTSP